MVSNQPYTREQVFPPRSAEFRCVLGDTLYSWTELKNICACVQLTISGLFLARFQSFDQWKFSPLTDVVFAGDFLGITTFDKMELDEF